MGEIFCSALQDIYINSSTSLLGFVTSRDKVSCDSPLPVITSTMVVSPSARSESGMMIGKSSASTGKKEVVDIYYNQFADILTFLADTIEGIGYTSDSLTT